MHTAAQLENPDAAVLRIDRPRHGQARPQRRRLVGAAEVPVDQRVVQRVAHEPEALGSLVRRAGVGRDIGQRHSHADVAMRRLGRPGLHRAQQQPECGEAPDGGLHARVEPAGHPQRSCEQRLVTMPRADKLHPERQAGGAGSGGQGHARRVEHGPQRIERGRPGIGKTYGCLARCGRSQQCVVLLEQGFGRDAHCFGLTLRRGVFGQGAALAVADAAFVQIGADLLRRRVLLVGEIPGALEIGDPALHVGRVVEHHRQHHLADIGPRCGTHLRHGLYPRMGGGVRLAPCYGAAQADAWRGGPHRRRLVRNRQQGRAQQHDILDRACHQPSVSSEPDCCFTPTRLISPKLGL